MGEGEEGGWERERKERKEGGGREALGGMSEGR